MADEPVAAGASAEAALEGTEVLALRVEFDLVPEWSNVVERIARHHGERVAVEGWAFAEDGKMSLALDVTLDDELRVDGRVLDLIRTLNDLRKTAGLELTDRIRVTLPEQEADLLPRADRIKAEVLAVSLDTDASATEPLIEKA